jgi:hypothetical protein
MHEQQNEIDDSKSKNIIEELMILSHVLTNDFLKKIGKKCSKTIDVYN